MFEIDFNAAAPRQKEVWDMFKFLRYEAKT